MQWIQHLIRASEDLDSRTRLELVELLERLKTTDPNDTKAVAAWERIRTAVPKVWQAIKPVRDEIISAAVKKLLSPDG
jgi:hypothetical protein